VHGSSSVVEQLPLLVDVEPVGQFVCTCLWDGGRVVADGVIVAATAEHFPSAFDCEPSGQVFDIN